ncbi:T9SS type A sorting domain-containing protein [Candidatus Nomurabacteria bacterium]|nr:MAG: T9SS type A sorting domain-containing protein [Candidatus Nomurabacteria bacterium]
MKNIALLLILLVGAINASAQTLFSQKFPLALGEPNNAPSSITANKDTLLLFGGTPGAVLWTANQQQIIPTTGLEGVDLSSDQKKVCAYFNNAWWVGGNFINSTCKYFAKMSGTTKHWTSPYILDGPVNDLIVTPEKMYVIGDFKTFDGDSVYHIVEIDLEGNVIPVGNQATLNTQSGMVIDGFLYTVEGEENIFFPEEKLKRYSVEGHIWEEITLPTQYQPGKVKVRTNVSNQPILVGEFMDENLTVSTGILTVGSESFIDCHWALSTDVWKGIMLITGVIDRINDIDVETCNLNYIGINGTFKAYDDDGCIGYKDVGVPFMEKYYAMIGSINGNGLVDIYVFDTAEFTITAVDEIRNVQALKLYPNPATDIITVDVVTHIDEIKIVNILGQQVVVPSVGIGSKVRLDIGDLPTGIYTIVIVSKDARSVARFEKIE